MTRKSNLYHGGHPAYREEVISRDRERLFNIYHTNLEYKKKVKQALARYFKE
jgi:hypothetical protein